MNVNDLKGKPDEPIWVRYEETDVHVLMVSATSKASQEYAIKEGFKARKRIRTGGIVPPEVTTPILIKQLALHVMKDWKGITATDEKTQKEVPIPFSTEAAAELLTASPDFREWVASKAQDKELFGLKIEVEGSTAQAESKSGPVAE